MTETDFIRALQQGLPPITPPVSLADAEHQHESVEGLFIETETMTTEERSPIVVPNSTSSHDANRLYGEAYGMDWVYESVNTSEPASEA
ncbi:hypothetical protein [Stenotrophomonas sp. C1657]|uniref:hypothetical protein n=1 Tax=Stenotrophomonas sp. C1657 TaxID=3077844 RepID=UPI00293C4C69|nr:hypothetical protein [Stenotrophomonas sp. C1657]MDV3515209.1 hypothetical protein [Stenotrophomonas sp. C1657]